MILKRYRGTGVIVIVVMIRRLKKCTALLLAVLLILQTAGLAVMAQEEKGKQEDQTAAERMQETGEEISERETSLSLTEKTQAQTGTPQTETQAPTETQAQTETQLQTETQTDSGQGTYFSGSDRVSSVMAAWIMPT